MWSFGCGAGMFIVLPEMFIGLNGLALVGLSCSLDLHTVWLLETLTDINHITSPLNKTCTNGTLALVFCGVTNL